MKSVLEERLRRYDEFIYTKYTSGLLDGVLSIIPYLTGTSRDIDERDRMFNEKRLLGRLSWRFSESRSIRANPDFVDLNQWIAEEFGNGLLETEKISTPASIQLVFHLGTLIAILGLQHLPILKDLIIYSGFILQRWMGKPPKDVPETHTGVPSLPISVERTISRFDDVEIKQTRDGFSMRLRK